MNKPIDKEEAFLRMLRLLENNPGLTQRDMTRGLNISLGKVNYCLSELSKQGLIRIERFRKAPKKTAYMHHLTPKGIEAIGKLAFNFLKRKIQEYDDLKREIRVLNDLLTETKMDINASELSPRLKNIID